MLIGFSERFADAVESGRKCQTIRALRKDGRVPKVGERVYLYTGLRKKGARKLGEGVVDGVQSLTIRSTAGWFHLYLDGIRQSAWDYGDFARADGFGDWPALVAWFEGTHGLPFTGHLIRWRLRRARGVEWPCGPRDAAPPRVLTDRPRSA